MYKEYPLSEQKQLGSKRNRWNMESELVLPGPARGQQEDPGPPVNTQAEGGSGGEEERGRGAGPGVPGYQETGS